MSTLTAIPRPIAASIVLWANTATTFIASKVDPSGTGYHSQITQVVQQTFTATTAAIRAANPTTAASTVAAVATISAAQMAVLVTAAIAVVVAQAVVAWGMHAATEAREMGQRRKRLVNRGKWSCPRLERGVVLLSGFGPDFDEWRSEAERDLKRIAAQPFTDLLSNTHKGRHTELVGELFKGFAELNESYYESKAGVSDDNARRYYRRARTRD